jgi:hypothetical protein
VGDGAWADGLHHRSVYRDRSRTLVDFEPAQYIACDGEEVAVATTTPNMVELQKSRLGMNKALQELSKQTAALENAIKTHPDKALGTAVAKVRQGLKAASNDLVDSLDKALNESDAARRAKLYDTARRISQDFLKMLDKDPLVKQIEHNPLLPVPARTAMVKALVALNRALS